MKKMFSAQSFLLPGFLAILLCSVPAQVLAGDREFYSIIVPGQNGAGGGTFEENYVVNTKPENKIFHRSIDPDWNQSLLNILKTWITADLGQGNCIARFEQQYQADNKAQDKAKLLYGVSQGTAMLTNWLAQKTPAEQNEVAKLLVLEGVLGSGNSAIMHTAANIPVVTYLPFVRLWLPWLAKAILFPTYNPLGKQAIASAKKLSPQLPVVIMHGKRDPQLSINDAREYYCALKRQGNNNAYLMEMDCGWHFETLWADPNRKQKIKDLQAIYKKYGLPAHEALLQDGTPTAAELAKRYQPSVEEVRKRMNATNGYTQVMRNIIDVTSAALVIGGIWWRYFRS